jgi:8-oxo-dGTP diphosphatase
MGGFVQPIEGFESEAQTVLKELTGLDNVYLEQLYAFGDPHRDSLERTTSIAYFSLIDIQKYEKQISVNITPNGFLLKKPHR